jgi:tRNA pseudouridine55 synthase
LKAFENTDPMTPFGILNVHKPAGRTSRDVVDRVERLVHSAKAGHAGTLDPLATGVLVICVGQATRLIEYVQRMPKSYQATFLWGRRSETEDVEGEVEEVAGASVPTRAMLDEQLPRFLGDIQQVPPAHSAVKIGGRRAYQLARAGKAPKLAARTVSIHRLTVRRYEYPELELDIDCGSGTYVRSLGRDLAAALGTSAVMSALVRTAVGRYRIEEAVSTDELSAETLDRHLASPLTALADMPRITLSHEQLAELHHGRLVPTHSVVGFDNTLATPPNSEFEYAAVDSSGELIAIVHEKRPGELWPIRNFPRDES